VGPVYVRLPWRFALGLAYYVDQAALSHHRADSLQQLACYYRDEVAHSPKDVARVVEGVIPPAWSDAWDL